MVRDGRPLLAQVVPGPLVPSGAAFRCSMGELGTHCADLEQGTVQRSTVIGQ